MATSQIQNKASTGTGWPRSNNDEMIKQQQEANQHSRETNKNFNTLIGVVKNSQSIVPNLSQLFGQQNISPQPQQSAVGERHGVVPFMLQKR